MPAPDLVVRAPVGQPRRILSPTRTEDDCRRQASLPLSSLSLTRLKNLSHVSDATYAKISLHQVADRFRLLGKPIHGTFAASGRFPRRLVKSPGKTLEKIAAKDVRVALQYAVELDAETRSILAGQGNALRSLMVIKENLDSVARRVRAPMDEEPEVPNELSPTETVAQMKIRAAFSRRFLAVGGVTALLRLVFLYDPASSMPKLPRSSVMTEIRSKYKDAWSKLVSTCMIIVQDICYALPDFGSTLGECSEFLALVARRLSSGPTFEASLRLLEDSVMSRANRQLDLATEFPPLRPLAMNMDPHNLAYFGRFLSQLALEESEYHVVVSGLDLLAYKRASIVAEEMGMNIMLRNHIYVLNVLPEIITRLVCVIGDRQTADLNVMFWPSFARMHGLHTRRAFDNTFFGGRSALSMVRITPAMAWRSAPTVQPLHLIRRPVRTHSLRGTGRVDSLATRLEQERRVSPANIQTEEEEEAEGAAVSTRVSSLSATATTPRSNSAIPAASSPSPSVSLLRRAMDSVLSRVTGAPPRSEPRPVDAPSPAAEATPPSGADSAWSDDDEDDDSSEGDGPTQADNVMAQLQAMLEQHASLHEGRTRDEDEDSTGSEDSREQDFGGDEQLRQMAGDARNQRDMLRAWASSSWANVAQREIWLQSPRQEAMHSLRALCSGPFRRSVQDALAKAGLIEALQCRFDRAVWDPSAQHVLLAHGPDCHCDLWSMHRTAIVRLLHEFCNRPSDNWYNKRLLFTQAELDGAAPTGGLLPNARISLSFPPLPPNVDPGEYDPEPGLPGGAATVRGRGLAWRLSAMLECDRVAQERTRAAPPEAPSPDVSPAEAQRRLEAKGEVRYLISAALEALVRGAQPLVSYMVGSWGVLDNVARGILAQHASAQASTNPNSGTLDQGLFQVQFDLLGELVKDSPAVLAWLCGGGVPDEVVRAFGPAFSPEEFESLMRIACTQLVDSNVFLRAFALTAHHEQEDLRFDISRAKRWLKDGGAVRVLRGLWSVIALENVSQDNVCCINTSVVLLTVARLESEPGETDAEALGRVVRAVKTWDESLEGRRTDDTAFRLQLNTPLSKRPVPGKPKEFHHEKPEANFRALLFFWRGYYNLRIGERYCMEFSTCFAFEELNRTVDLLCDASGATHHGALLEKGETVRVPYMGVNLRDLARHVALDEPRKRFKEDGNDHGRHEIEGWATRGRAWGRN